jgi:maleate cis-trans isomerase
MDGERCEGMIVERTSHPTVYGARAKLGVIVPPTNTANEAEWNRMAPPGVTIHATRMKLHIDTVSVAGKRALRDDLARAAGDLAQAAASVIAYGCTAGSMTVPATQLSDYMESITGCPCVTTAQALVAALRVFGAKRVAVATPYDEVLNRHEAEFLRGHGFDVLAIRGMGYGAGGPAEYRHIARVPTEEVLAFARDVFVPTADAMLISCTDLATLSVIERLESETGKPVVSSNQATFWLALRKAAVADRLGGMGRLLAHA